MGFLATQIIAQSHRKMSLKNPRQVVLVIDHGKEQPSYFPGSLEKGHVSRDWGEMDFFLLCARALTQSAWKPIGSFSEGLSCLLISGPQSSVNMDLYCGAERLCRAFSALVDQITLSNLK